MVRSVDVTFSAFRTGVSGFRIHFGDANTEVFDGAVQVSAEVLTDMLFDDFGAAVVGLKLVQEMGDFLVFGGFFLYP